MTPKAKNIAVGIFVLSVSLGLIIFISWLGARTVQQESEIYRVLMDESVSGLSENAPVKYKGVTIGFVDQIRIAPDRTDLVELLLKVNKGTPIKTDSKVLLASQGITGIQYIEITGGDPNLPNLKQDDKSVPEIPVTKSTFATVEAAVGPLLQDISIMIGDIHHILQAAEPETLRDIISDVKDITGGLAESTKEVQHVSGDMKSISENVDATLSNANQLISNANQLVLNSNQFVTRLQSSFDEGDRKVQNILDESDQSSRRVNRILTDLEALSSDLRDRQLAAKLDGTLEQANQLLSGLNGQVQETDVAQLSADASLTLEEIRLLSESMRLLADQLRRQPNTLIFGGSQQEIDLQ